MKDFEQYFLALPQIQKGRGLWQNEHHDYDVYKHTLRVVEQMKKLTSDKNLIAAAYLHDIAKPATATPRLSHDGKQLFGKDQRAYHNFSGHEFVGEKMVMAMDREIFVGFGLDQERIARIVGAHYDPMKAIKRMRKASSYAQFLKCFKELKSELSSKGLLDEIMMMFLADKLGQAKNLDDRQELFLVRRALLGEQGLLRKVYKMMR